LTQAQAQFTERLHCINCGSKEVIELSRGKFTDEPLRGFIENDPWGEAPLPFLRDAEWVLVRCRRCDQIFHRRILDPEWSERCFSSWMSAGAIHCFEEREAAHSGDAAAGKFSAGRAHAAHALRIEKLTRAIRKPGETVRLLDFGCGWGAFVLMCRLFGFDSRGVDRSAARIDGAAVAVHASLDDVPQGTPSPLSRSSSILTIPPPRWSDLQACSSRTASSSRKRRIVATSPAFAPMTTTARSTRSRTSTPLLTRR
jgi:hypothetical protein